MSSKYVIAGSTSVVIREMQIKVTKRCHFTPTRMAIIRKANAGKAMKRRKLSYTVSGNVN